MISARMRSLSFSCVLLVTGPALAEEVGVRKFPVPQQGVFQLQVPKSWKDGVSQPPGSTTPTIVLTGGGEEAFEVSLTPLWRTRPGTGLADPAEIKRKVELAADQAKQQSVEKELVIQEIKGASAVGYYFSATDRAPKPGEFKHMMQGTIRAGELLVLFTVLTQDGGDSVRRQSIAVLESATFAGDEVSPSSAGAAAGRPDAIQITQTDTHYVLTVPLSRLVMQFPKSTLVLVDRQIGGGTNSPRYFYFKDRESPFIASGWFESQQAFAGIQKFWADEVASWNQRLPAPQNVAFSKTGGWETIAYEIPVPDVTFSNLRAHWVQAGTWIDLHLSLTNRQAAREARARLVAFLASVSVGEKK